MKRVSEDDSPVGALMLTEEDGMLTEIRFLKDTEKLASAKVVAPGESGITKESFLISPVLEKARRELAEYFAGERQRFTFPYEGKGTAFQRRVWRALEQIPYGETRSYRQIAAAVGNPGACRPVGMANHANPLPIVVPCHRVIGADGRLTGYAGGLDIKERLLALEGIRLQG